jgi:protein-tyrosine-phosphatase/tRNA A37 threonylcarbamoyladenosine synthetase subunit TsaC/SUA5/YrdC
MTTEVINWHNTADPHAVLERVVRTLLGGGVAGLPTEAGYVLAAAARLPEAVARLGDGTLAVAVRGPGEAADWVPGISPLGRRLARRCWPGPVAFVFRDGVRHGVASRLPAGVADRLCSGDAVELRMPSHEALLAGLRLLPGPLVLAPAGPSGRPAMTADEVLQGAGTGVDLLLDDGLSRYPGEASAVEVNGNDWRLLREGVVPASLIQRQAACLIIFVCTGNTCRSPLAEALCKKLLAERLGCTSEELPQRGFFVLSAGLAAMMGGPAAEEAVAVAAALSADLGGHRSRKLSAELAAGADHLLVMTHGHLLAVAEQYRHLGLRPRLLSRHGEDVPDPIGFDLPVYQECAQQIQRHLEEFVSEILGPAASVS